MAGDDVKIVFDRNGNPWFSFKELSTMLGYQVHAKELAQISPENIKAYPDIDGLTDRDEYTKHPDTKFINEPGMYELLLDGTNEIAQAFREEIFGNILPRLRKTGKYVMSRKHITILKKINNALRNQSNQIGGSYVRNYRTDYTDYKRAYVNLRAMYGKKPDDIKSEYVSNNLACGKQHAINTTQFVILRG